MKTITDLLAKGISSSPALIGIEPETAITYGELREVVASLAERLASGLEPESRVAMVLPNGSEFIVTFIALLQAGLTAAPYNPAQGAELANLWRDADIRAVIAAVDDQASRDTAAQVGLPVWALSINSKGRAELAVETSAGIGNPASPALGSIAWFLHTSGTTSKPKGVPLTNGNLMASLENIASGYQLTAEDRTMLVMPLCSGMNQNQPWSNQEMLICPSALPGSRRAPVKCAKTAALLCLRLRCLMPSWPASSVSRPDASTRT